MSTTGVADGISLRLTFPMPQTVRDCKPVFCMPKVQKKAVIKLGLLFMSKTMEREIRLCVDIIKTE